MTISDSIKLKTLGIGIILCLGFTAFLAYSNWALHDKVTQLEKNQNASDVSPSLTKTATDRHHLFDAIWDRFNDMDKHFSQMDSMMNSMLSRHGLMKPLTVAHKMPVIEFEETDDQYKVIIEAIDGEEMELNTEINNGVLSVSGKVKQTTSKNDNNVHSQSYFTGEFSRSFVLDEPVDQAGMEMINEQGKTIVVLPKQLG